MIKYVPVTLGGALIEQVKECTTDTAILTFADKGFASFLRGMLNSLKANSGIPSFSYSQFVVNLDGSKEITDICHAFSIREISCRTTGKISSLTKSAMYSAATFLPHPYIICLDADIIIQDSLTAPFQKMKTSDRLLIAEDSGISPEWTLTEAWARIYSGKNPQDYGLYGYFGSLNTHINEGVVFGSRKIYQEIDEELKYYLLDFPKAQKRTVRIVNQAYYNYAILRCGFYDLLPENYNFLVKSHKRTAFLLTEPYPRVLFKDIKPAVIHFAGDGKDKEAFPILQNYYK